MGRASPSAHTGHAGLGENPGEITGLHPIRQFQCTSTYSRDPILSQAISDDDGRTQFHMALQGLGLFGAGYPRFSTVR
jgi:hypothetical protein